MGFVGLDVMAIRLLSRRLEEQAAEADKAATVLSAALDSVAWTGADQRRFAEEWASIHRPAITRTAELLREASAEASRNAVEQERTSGTA
jgi:uncharacterized protein YukE